jgi:hypothetical protein
MARLLFSSNKQNAKIRVVVVVQGNEAFRLANPAAAVEIRITEQRWAAIQPIQELQTYGRHNYTQDFCQIGLL